MQTLLFMRLIYALFLWSSLSSVHFMLNWNKGILTDTKLETTQFFLETLIVLTTPHKPVKVKSNSAADSNVQVPLSHWQEGGEVNSVLNVIKNKGSFTFKLTMAALSLTGKAFHICLNTLLVWICPKQVKVKVHIINQLITQAKFNFTGSVSIL